MRLEVDVQCTAGPEQQAEFIEPRIAGAGLLEWIAARDRRLAERRHLRIQLLVQAPGHLIRLIHNGNSRLGAQLSDLKVLLRQLGLQLRETRGEVPGIAAGLPERRELVRLGFDLQPLAPQFGLYRGAPVQPEDLVLRPAARLPIVQCPREVA